MADQPITAFHGVFEQKLSNIIKKIKKARKDPKEKHKVKELLGDAKKLKKLIKKDRKSSPVYAIDVPITVVDGVPMVSDAIAILPIKILDTYIIDFNKITIQFELVQTTQKDNVSH